MYKVIVAHPSRQHSYKTAEALKTRGMLYKYVTRVYNNGSSLWLRLAKKVSKGEQLKRIENRRSEMLDDCVLLIDETLGYIQQILGKIDKKKRIYFHFLSWSSKHFGIKVAKYAIKENVDAVVFYDTVAYWGMRYLKRHHSKIKCILDNSAAPINYRNKLILENKRECGEYWKTLEHLNTFNDVDLSRRETEELLLADYHLAASTFSKSGLMYNGISEDRIYVVPYGVDEAYFGEKKKDRNEGLTCLFVGHINQIKGVAQILECARRLADKEIQFVMVGSGREAYPDLYPDVENVSYLGTLFGEKLKEAYLNADIFLFPAMGEGFGLVILEAMAAGLPVISTYNCGGPDVISDGQDGLLMENCSAECLYDKIMWFLDHRDQLPVMGMRAMETAKRYSWKRYYAGITEAISDMLDRKV